MTKIKIKFLQHRISDESEKVVKHCHKTEFFRANPVGINLSAKIQHQISDESEKWSNLTHRMKICDIFGLSF